VLSRDAVDLAEQAGRAVAEGVERLIVAGGDGSFHHAAQGLAGTDCALGLVPLGRGNDLAAALGIPRGLQESTSFAEHGPVRRIDVGSVNGILFTGYCGLGFDSEAARIAQAAPSYLRGPLAYGYSVLRTLWSFEPPVLELQYDGGEFEGRAMFAVACNISRFGGGMLIAPTARADDGLLDLVIAREIGRLELLRVFPRVYRGGHVTHPAVRIVRTRTVSIRVDRSMTVAADGEPLFEAGASPISVSLRPGALRVVAPR
jgi:diacylglycerol kinase (ATP)